MPRQITQVFPRERQQAEALGARIRAARLRRRIPLIEMAARVGIDRKTQSRLEKGDPSTSMAALIRNLSVLGLASDLDRLAKDDEVGRRLSDLATSERPHRRHAANVRRS